MELEMIGDGWGHVDEVYHDKLPSCLTPFSTLPVHYIEPDLSRMRRQLSSHFYSGIQQGPIPLE